MKQTFKPYIILFVLIAIFSLPGIAAYFVYHHPEWLASKTTNKGTFVNPPILLAELPKNKKWRLILWQPTACNKNCLQEMDRLARIRLALGRRLYEVDTYLLLNSADPLSSKVKNTLKEQDIHVASVSSEVTNQLTSTHNQPTIFIANPDNYFVLQYEKTTASNNIFHDLKQLLSKG